MVSLPRKVLLFVFPLSISFSFSLQGIDIDYKEKQELFKTGVSHLSFDKEKHPRVMKFKAWTAIK